MMHWPHTPRLLRVVAIVIAIAGLLDPVITTNRPSKPTVAVIAIDPPRDSALASRVIATMSSSFSVIPAPFARADATILVGDHLPAGSAAIASPVFAVANASDGPTLTITTLEVPARVPMESQVPVTSVIAAEGARGRQIEVSLQAGGLLVGQVTRRVASELEVIAVPLAFAPSTVGMVALRVTATVIGGDDSPGERAVADASVDIRAQRWDALFYDPRPSWMSTFVRRAVEGDARFLVTSRVVTSRNISTDAGGPPASLDNLAALARFDLIVVGAPEALSEREVAGLEAYLRQRGGRVILLLDDHAAGPWERLAAVGSWGEYQSREQSIRPATGDTLGLRASEMTWPTRLPAGAEPVASAATSSDSNARAPVVWRSAIGAGELIVSGALDSWRFRDSTLSGFDHFWRSVSASAAASAPPELDLTISQPLLSPGEHATVTATLREPSLQWQETPRAVSANITAVMEPATGPLGSSAGRINVRLWPSGPVGQFSGEFPAPTSPGRYQISVLAGGNQAAAPFVVAPDVHHANRANRELLDAWVSARGGRVVLATKLNLLANAVLAAVHPERRPERWHPMRSPWWLVLFALALSAEWWLIRRRGGA